MKLRINWDALGITASLACAIHCALLPLFLSSLPFLGIDIINNKIFETAMIALAFGIGSYALLHGYWRHHHKVLPVFIFFVGFIFLILKEFFIDYNNWLLIPAVLFIVSGHIINYYYCHRAKHSHRDDCSH